MNATSSFPASQKTSPGLSQRENWATCGSKQRAGPQFPHLIKMCGRTCRWGTSLKESLPGSPRVEHQIEHQMLNPGPLPTQQDRSKNLRAGNSFSGRKMCLGFLGTVEYSEGFNEGNETICGCGGVRTRDMNLPHYPQTIQATKSELRRVPLP